MLEYVPVLRMRKGDDLLVRVKLFDRHKSVLLHAKDALKVMFLFYSFRVHKHDVLMYLFQ